MVDYRIIHPENGKLAIIVPAPGVTQEQALRAVPTGSPYLIVDVSELPEDIIFFDAWEADFTDALVKE
jgi:DNA-binding PucR family transcriptional regulator